MVARGTVVIRKEYRHQLYINNRDKELQASHVIYQKNKDKRYKQTREWVRRNPERARQLRKRGSDKLKVEVFSHYTSWDKIIRCVCCNERELAFLTLDHIDNNGKEHRKKAPKGASFYRYLKKNNYPIEWRLQILCMQCNWAKRVTGICPHQQAIYIEL